MAEKRTNKGKGTYDRESYLLNREKNIARQKLWNENNKQRVRAYLDYWKACNPDKVAEYQANRRSGKSEMIKAAKEAMIQEETQRLVVEKHRKKVAKEVMLIETKAEREEVKRQKHEERQRIRREQYATNDTVAIKARERACAWRLANLERVKENDRLYRIRCKEEIAVRRKARYEASKLKAAQNTPNPSS